MTDNPASDKAVPRAALVGPAVGSPDDGLPPGVATSPGTTVRLADWLMGALVAAGIRHVFMVAGGGAMHLNDAAGAEPGLEVVCFLHEQAATIAAEAYAKASGTPPLCLVTTGPGGTNAVTGVAGAFVDSTPMLVVSGQVKRADRTGSTGVRQRGIQEIDICSIVGAITKDAQVLDDPAEVRHAIERALHLAQSGRPGPVWLDIPLDVQASPIHPEQLDGYLAPAEPPGAQLGPRQLALRARDVVGALAEARRPIVLAGAGVRLADAEAPFRAFVERAGLPVLTTWAAQGVLGDDHPLLAGRPGLLAARGANFALQNADLLLTIGARLEMSTTGYDAKEFGRNAHKIVVDIDPAELTKLEGAADELICADARDFLEALLAALPVAQADATTGAVDDVEAPRRDGSETAAHAAWLARCRAWRERYPVVQPEHAERSEHVSTYHFADVLSDVMSPDDVLAFGSSGLAIEIFLLALRLRTGQRAVLNFALGAMGYGPPVAIGACIGSGRRRTVCVDGDGGLQLNIQELETIRRLALPIKLFVLANDGYASIRASQQRWFGRLIGADATSGMTLPSLEAIAGAYGLSYRRIDPAIDLRPQLVEVLEQDGPVVCEVPTPSREAREPVQVSEALPDGSMRSRPMEDLAPLLSREELAANLDPNGSFPLVELRANR